jgi:hypothetical protein
MPYIYEIGLLGEQGSSGNYLSNGLNYMRAGYYSPTLKRFINADTLKGSIKDGEWGNAGLSVVNAIPFVGDITDSLKIGKDTVEVGKDLETVDKIVEDANVVSEGAAEAEQGVWEMSEGGATINGRNYSQHALERMAPDTPQVRAELERRAADIAQGKGLEPGTKAYSDFVNKYVDPRNIPPSVIEDAINNTNATPGKYADTFVHETGDVTVVVNGAGNVITVIPK